MSKKFHFIALGGSVMHNLALSLQYRGFEVTGSDDEIYEPSSSKLEKAGILPESFGWYPEKIHPALDGVIVGMHAKEDNPELVKALELNIPVFSFPEFIFEQSKNKKRVVIAGSHGKTTITAMILHVMKFHNMDFDYLVGAQIQGFDLMVKLSSSPLIVIEGDEYLTSPMDRRPKFLHYKHDLLLLSGIAWDHYNVFPTFGDYLGQFKSLLELTPENGHLIYCALDEHVKYLVDTGDFSFKKTPYTIHDHSILKGKTFLKTPTREIPLEIFGDHNLQNLQGALEICLALGIGEEKFFQAISTFKGAAKRQEILAQSHDKVLIRDFAHAPSKLKATVEAVKNQFPERKLIAVQELHTYSSLNQEFLGNYANTFESADEAIVYLNPKAVSLKKLDLMDQKTLRKGFNRKDLKLFTQKESLQNYLELKSYDKSNLLLMSSGNFDTMDLSGLMMKFNTTIQ